MGNGLEFRNVPSTFPEILWNSILANCLPPPKKNQATHINRVFSISHPQTSPTPHLWFDLQGSPQMPPTGGEGRFFLEEMNVETPKPRKPTKKKNMYTKPLSFTIKSYFQKKIYPTKMVKLWMNQTNPPRTSGGISPPTIFFMSTLSTFNDCS